MTQNDRNYLPQGNYGRRSSYHAARPQASGSRFSRVAETDASGSTRYRSSVASGANRSRGHASGANPYEQHGRGGRQGGRGRGASSSNGLLTRGGLPSKGPQGGDVRRNVIIAAIVIALVGAGWLFFTHRSVDLTVNGTKTSIVYGSTLDQVISHENLSVTPGNLVSVSGKTLTAGQGAAYSATVDGNQLTTVADESAYRVHGGESIDISDGFDTTEDYDTSVVEVQPKLTMDGAYGAISYVSQWGKVTKQEVRTGKVSGETANGDVIEQGQDCVVKNVNITPSGDQKLVALTFDDGPSKYTEQYLQILKDHGAVATFFNLGQNVDEYPDQAKAIVDAGSQLASHTYSHDDLPTDSSEKVVSEVTSAFSSIKTATGTDTTVIRPPYGDFKEKTWLETGGCMSVSVIWNMDSEDWRLPGASTIVSNATTGIKSGYIILMHDGGGNRDQDVEALPQIIDNLHNEGYTFVTIADLMRSAGDIPEDVCSGSATMPSDAVWPTEIG